MKRFKVIGVMTAVIVLLMFTKSYGITLSNIIRSTVTVSHDVNDPKLVVLQYNDKDLGKQDINFTSALISGFDVTIDLKSSIANSIKYLKMKASVVSKMQVMLPEFGIVDLGRVEYNKVDYKDLSTVPASSPLDSEGDGIKLITMERLASEDNDGDDSKLTVPCTVTYLNDNTISSDINMSILLPDVAAAWGDNSHIKNAVFNPNNTGRLVVINAPAGQKETLNIIARSNKIVPHVRYIIAEVQYDGKYITLGQSEDKSIEPGIDVNMEVPIEFKKAGTYELKIYALVTGP